MAAQIRVLTDGDLASVIDLLNEKNRESYEFVPFTEDRIRSWMQEGRLKVLVVEEDGKVVGSTAYDDGHWGEEIEWLAVSDVPVRRIIEDALVEEVEKYVKGKKVFTAVDAGSSRINEWIERGYNAEGGLYHMVANLTSAKCLPIAPEGMAIRSLKLGEDKDLIETVNAGFGWERLKQNIFQKWKTDSPDFSEEWVHVVEAESKLVSVVVSKADTNHNKFFGGKRGYLGPAATLPEYRGKNLASALTCQAMNFLFEKGMDSVALYTSEQNIPSVTLLQKLGFRISHHWKFICKDLSQQI